MNVEEAIRRAIEWERAQIRAIIDDYLFDDHPDTIRKALIAEIDERWAIIPSTEDLT